ncbi:MAG: DNA/RNA non-specific endonuclease [Flavobacteriales bacterium]|nr:DNA/RNA non-specific endonuclease [Flavobacteriales bacterium]
MRFLSVLLVFLFTTQAFAQTDAIIAKEKELTQLDKKRENLLADLEVLKLKRNLADLQRIGLPVMKDSGTTYSHSAFIFNYNESAEQANWVAHIISPEITSGIITRTNDFRVDSLVKTGSADLNDYWMLGYDRGHLAPSADFRWSLKALSESYLYSNMAPQHAELNRERWAEAEDLLRAFVVDNQRPLYVVTGPVLEPGLDSIGPNRVAVPKRFYKVAIDYTQNPPQSIGFVMPNIYCKYPVMYYALPVDSVENLTGIDFFSRLPQDVQAKSESTRTDSVWLVKSARGNVAPLRKDQLPKGAINTLDAKNYEGKTAKVCGKIVATKYSEKSGSTFLNFDQKFPDQLFYISIWKSDLPNFPYEPHRVLLNKNVCVTGKVTLNRGIPTINIKNEKAMEIFEEEE